MSSEMSIMEKLLEKYRLPACKQGLEGLMSEEKNCWDWIPLSWNPTISFDFILKHLDWPWYWSYISGSLATWKDVKAHPELPWNLKWLSGNPNITLKNILDTPDPSYDMYQLPLNPAEQYKNWDWYRISGNPSITLKMILDNPELPWDWDAVSGNYNISQNFQQVIDHPEIPWNWFWLSENSTLPFQYVLDHPVPRTTSVVPNGWDWKLLSSNPAFTLQNILDHPELPWDWRYVSLNTGIDIKDVFRNPQHTWDWELLSSNPSITIDDILANSTLDWNWRSLSANPHITLKHIQDYSDLPWDWKGISRNPNLTMKFIEDNLDKISFTDMGMNTFKTKWRKANQIIDTTMAMRPLGLPPYVLDTVLDFAYSTSEDPALTLMERIELITGITERIRE